MAIISNQNVQEATGLDRPGLLRRFSMKWTPESALKDCKLFIIFYLLKAYLAGQQLNGLQTMIPYEETAYHRC